MKLHTLTAAIVFTTMALAQKAPQRSAPANPRLPSARSILDKAVAATGGKAAFQAIQTQRLVGKVMSPDIGILGTVTAYRNKQGQSHLTIDIPGAGTTVQANDGDVEWMDSTLTGPKIVRVASTPGNLLVPGNEYMTPEDYSKMEVSGTDSVDGKPCYSVDLKVKERNEEINACYDTTSFLALRMITKAGATATTSVFSDYRDVAGVKMAFTVRTEVKDRVVEMKFESITANEPFPPNLLDVPDDIEKLLQQRESTEIREAEEDKDRPKLRRRPAPAAAPGKKKSAK